MDKKTAIIIGAGPAGLTAALELLTKSQIRPIVYESSGETGGLCKTIRYKGNLLDIGPHRYFSKSERVMQWWEDILPLQGAPSKDDILLRRKIPLSRKKDAPDPEKEDKVMLIRNRYTRIYYRDKFYRYPISLSPDLFINLGLMWMVKIMVSYWHARFFPIKEEKSLEDFFINRFGRALYETFFRDYSLKVWGIPCREIRPDWGSQRVKGLSIGKTLYDAIVRKLPFAINAAAQYNGETSLLGQFLYPKLGAGQVWEEVARLIREKGGVLHLNHTVTGFETDGDKIVSAEIRDQSTGAVFEQGADYFFSSMPVRDLIEGLGKAAPGDVRDTARGLMYRQLVIAGVLVRRLKTPEMAHGQPPHHILPDQWIYIQATNVKLVRLMICNNLSPYLVKDENNVWMGVEYTCGREDALWNLPDDEILRFAVKELCAIHLIEEADFIDGTVCRVPHAYPVYAGTYHLFPRIKEYTMGIENLFLIGRAGMHRYNNIDHSMLTAMSAVENVVRNIPFKQKMWDVNSEKDYHENS